ncbi:CopD family protein [Elioraea sp.]|uniref:CopD family protein n=1 Tax=Elioraea sp. TaxID=2185103 RepID=UPI0025BE7564|nr:CopD family protein [Elioraea sp.]
MTTTMPTTLFVLHLLAAIVWVGGMAFAILVLRPSLAVLEPPQRLLLHAHVFRRFFMIIWHAMPIILVTGWALLFGWYGGFRDAGVHVHVMNLTGVIMAVVFLVIWFGPYAAFRAAMDRGDGPAAAAAANRVRLLITLNLVLGLITSIVAGFGRWGL